MLVRWDLTVLSEMNSSAAISLLVRPRAIAAATSSSRADSGIGTRADPGSTNALNNLKLPMPAVVAALVILGWLIVPAVAGAWRTRTRDA
jgi:uncharacterized membrane protein